MAITKRCDSHLISQDQLAAPADIWRSDQMAVKQVHSLDMLDAHIAHGRMSVSWGVEATATAHDFRDQYCARVRHEV